MTEEKTEWVDFKAVKEAVTMQMVLEHYSIGLKYKHGDELRGLCPIHDRGRGSLATRHFSVNLQKNIFQCFNRSCKAKGNVLDFVAKRENCSVRDAALKLAEWFQIESAQAEMEPLPSPALPEEFVSVEKTQISRLITELMNLRDEIDDISNRLSAGTAVLQKFMKGD